jgi:CheY-like chemotaxis protein
LPYTFTKTGRLAEIKNILLIDDDEDDQEIFLAALQQVSTSLSLIAERNAREALDKLVARLLSPDVIFLDLNMPGMNGQQFLSAIKKGNELKDIPVIIYSTSSQLSVIRHTKDMGAAGYITKPDSVEGLIEILLTYL